MDPEALWFAVFSLVSFIAGMMLLWASWTSMAAVGALLLAIPLAFFLLIISSDGPITSQETWSGIISLWLAGVGCGLLLASVWPT